MVHKTLTTGVGMEDMEAVPSAKMRRDRGGRAGAAPTLQNAQGSIDAQPDFRALLGTIDNGIIGPEAEPIVRGQSGDMVTQEKEDTQEGQEEPNCFHVVPVHGELDLQPRREGALQSTPAGLRGSLTEPTAWAPQLPDGWQHGQGLCPPGASS